MVKVLDGKQKTILKDSIPNCRFCNRTNLEATFKQETHVITQQLNRSQPISKFECDDCNSRFSKLESDFGHYMLFDRSVFGHKKKKSGYPKFKTDSGSEFQRVSDIEKIKSKFDLNDKQIEQLKNDEARVLNLFTSFEDHESKITREGKKFNFKLKRPPYIPNNVYKIFLKIGLSMISEENKEKYSKAYAYLENGKDSKLFEEVLVTWTIPILHNYFHDAIVCLHELRNNSTNKFDSMLIMYFGNKMYQIGLTSDRNIELKEKGTNYILMTMSPYLNPTILLKESNPKDKFYKELAQAELSNHDLSSNKIIRNEEFNETLKINLISN